jgi:hypothetical protein
VICTLRIINSMSPEWGKIEMRIGYWWESQKERDL